MSRCKSLTLALALRNYDADNPSSSISEPQKHKDLAPKSPPLSQLPQRRNAFDDDEFDKLAMDVTKVSFGKRPEKTADQLLQDKTSAPGKAAILSALAAFDSDDDERDDTYDARSEEHTSELQSRLHLVCRLLLEKKKKK